MPRIHPKADSQFPINIFKTMDVCKPLVNGFMAFKKELDKGTLSNELKEKIALTAAGINGCDYCTQAHTHIARKEGVSDAGIDFATQGKCGDPKTDAALKFVSALINKKGHIDDADFNALKDAGWSDEESLEIFGQTMLNMVTNYFNDFTCVDYDDEAIQKLLNK